MGTSVITIIRGILPVRKRPAILAQLGLDSHYLISVCDLMEDDNPAQRNKARYLAKHRLAAAIRSGEDIVFIDTLATKDEVYKVLHTIFFTIHETPCNKTEVTIIDHIDYRDVITQEHLVIANSFELLRINTYMWKS